MGKGTIEFGAKNVENAFGVIKALIKEGYEVLIRQDEFGNVAVGYNKVDWTDETYTLITFTEIDLLNSFNKEKKESDE
jgi:hypothetical protein